MPKAETSHVAALHEKFVNKTAMLTVELSLQFEVTLADARAKFGRVDVLVRPTKGTGERWVSSERLTDIRPRAHN